MFEKFTVKARKVMAYANRQAEKSTSNINTGHILLGLIWENAAVGANVLEELAPNFNLEKAEEEVQKRMTIEKDGINIEVVKNYAIEEARDMGLDWVGTGHILLGLLKDSKDEDRKIIARDILLDQGVTIKEARKRVKRAYGRKDEETPPTGSPLEEGKDIDDIASKHLRRAEISPKRHIFMERAEIRNIPQAWESEKVTKFLVGKKVIEHRMCCIHCGNNDNNHIIIITSILYKEE